jgi:hypothetical protein
VSKHSLVFDLIIFHLFIQICFTFQCLGADVVFDLLGIALDDKITDGNIGSIAGLVVYHIIDGE